MGLAKSNCLIEAGVLAIFNFKVVYYSLVTPPHSELHPHVCVPSSSSNSDVQPPLATRTLAHTTKAKAWQALAQ